MIDNFSFNCLDLFDNLCKCEKISKLNFFNMCVESRLNYLVDSNSKVLDSTLDQLEKYIDNLITDTIPYVRCNNYKQKQKNAVKQNINKLSKIFKRYNKSCQCSARLLQNLLKKEAD